MGELVIGGAIVLLCSNATVATIIASTGVLLDICGIKIGRKIAIGTGVIYVVVSIVVGVIA